MNPMDLKRGIDASVKLVIEDLEKRRTDISKPEEIQQVATISANGDAVIGRMVAEAFEKVGKDGTITVAEGKTMDHELEVVEGMKFDRGYISPHFVTDTKAQKCVFTDPLILLFDKKISSVQSILPVLEHVAKAQRPLVIVAEDVDGEALATMVVNKLRGGLQVAAVKAPGFGDHRKAMLQDLAVLSGAEMISEELGRKLDETFDPSVLGTAKTVTITKDDTVVLDGAGGQEAIRERCEQIQAAVESTASEYERDKLRERLAKLSGGVAVIKVGGASEVEVQEVKDRLNDALNATRAAVEEGIVPGGGTALLYASRALDGAEMANFDQNVGRDIVKQALRMPITTIVKNAGKEGIVVVEHLAVRWELGLQRADGRVREHDPGGHHRPNARGTNRAGRRGVRGIPDDNDGGAHRRDSREEEGRWCRRRHGRHGRYGRHGRHGRLRLLSFLPSLA
ncbi:unnamed protein product [Prorocentrum cordatum]|uniref:60 kDa chaperonin n=1 Tax=Prorocentrum cordatum TaxID=2364126 RepID=A0ABN9U663_9DINO|nr:unnamed protein product [Polarella glacialis]